MTSNADSSSAFKRSSPLPMEAKELRTEGADDRAPRRFQLALTQRPDSGTAEMALSLVLQLRRQRRLRHIYERISVDLLEVAIARYLEENVEFRKKTAHDMANAGLARAMEAVRTVAKLTPSEAEKSHR